MLIKNNITKEELNGFLYKQDHNQFLQSWQWGEFQEAAGNKVIRLGLEEDSGELVGVLTLIKKELFFGFGYLYGPRVAISDFRFPISDLFLEIKKIASKEKCIFLRIEPLSDTASRKSKIVNRKSLNVQPPKTLILDLAKTEEEILGRMHHKTRYNIRLAERNGVKTKIIAPQDKRSFEDFWKIMQETNKRDKFRLHDKEYYRKMLAIDLIRLIGAFYQGKMIAANIISFFGDTAVYVHGASANEHRNLMAPYALQWHTIKAAKAEGCEYYDFFGIDEKKWPGVTRFKKGFGGEEFDYPGTFDYIFNPIQYKLYCLLRRIRRGVL